MKLKTAIIILLMFSGLGCRKENEDMSGKIIGKWDWVKSVSSWTGRVSDPGTAGYRSELEFTKDGKMNEYRNDTLSFASDYKIEAIPAETDKYMLLVNSAIRSQIFLDRDTLIVNSAFVDGPVSWYTRLK